MVKSIEQTPAAKSLSAWVILDPKGRHIANVQAHYANTGGVTVEVTQWGDDVTERTARAMGYTLDENGKIVETRQKLANLDGKYAYHVARMQRRHVGGYGYDKTTAALSGMIIDGHRLTDHCGERLERPKRRLWQDSDRKRLAKKGYTLSNWSAADTTNTYGRKGVPADMSGWTDAYRMAGLEYLGAMGYRVIKAL